MSSDIDESIVIDDEEEEVPDGCEGGLKNKNFFQSVGSMAYLKQPGKLSIPIRYPDMTKSVMLEET